MALEEATQYLKEKGFADRIRIFEVSSATVELAALAVGTEPARIAKSLTFKVEEQPVMIVCAGDAKINNAKYKAYFHKKAKMLTKEEVHEWIGHDVGGVCPFGIHEGVDVYLDLSLKRFEKVYPACGSANSAVELTPDELEELSGCIEWIDVCKIPEEENENGREKS
ncbi:MAG: YbaK/EbsC family protein [Eubacterium sp.]